MVKNPSELPDEVAETGTIMTLKIHFDRDIYKERFRRIWAILWQMELAWMRYLVQHGQVASKDMCWCYITVSMALIHHLKTGPSPESKSVAKIRLVLLCNHEPYENFKE